MEESEGSPSFEKAGLREKIFFDPSKSKCSFVTCSGLCTGLNNAIMAMNDEEQGERDGFADA
ncbi:MAG: hypothetical protein OS130_07750 [Thermodesulfobacteriota bacterium]|nr:MAG: hypothetical protein OS130_07750 [Thermodesulfobacteriota bacterium]